MRLSLLLLNPIVLTYLAECSARSTDTSSNQRLRQSVDAVDVRSEGNVKGQMFLRMLQAKSVEKESDDEEDSMEERAMGLPIEIRNALEQGHASDEVMAKALKNWFGMADVDQDMQDFKTFTPKQMKLLDEVYENWAEAGITPKEITDTLLRHGHQGYIFDTVIDGYLKYLTAKDIAKFRAERIAKAAAGPQ